MTAIDNERPASERIRASISEGIASDLGVAVRVRDIRELLADYDRVSADRAATAAENADLLLENLALTAPPTDAQVEAAAAALWAGFFPFADWPGIPESTREGFRFMARTALTAAGNAS